MGAGADAQYARVAGTGGGEGTAGLGGRLAAGEAGAGIPGGATAACEEEVAAGDSATIPHLHVYGGDVAHQLVLPYCRLVLHHAGSGTTAAALQCGVPQVRHGTGCSTVQLGDRAGFTKPRPTSRAPCF
jgi:hypothetical protein